MTPLCSVEQFEELRARPVAVVFKHSTLCPASAHAREEVRSVIESRPGLEVHEVRVIEDRKLSDHIAAATGVLHESPQVLVFRMGEVIWHGSHSGVRAEAIATALGRRK